MVEKKHFILSLPLHLLMWGTSLLLTRSDSSSGRVSEKIDSISPDSQAQQNFLAIVKLDLGRFIGIYYSVFFCVAFSSTFHWARMTLLVAILAPLGPLWLMVAACGPNMY